MDHTAPELIAWRLEDELDLPVLGAADPARDRESAHQALVEELYAATGRPMAPYTCDGNEELAAARHQGPPVLLATVAELAARRPGRTEVQAVAA